MGMGEGWRVSVGVPSAGASATTAGVSAATGASAAAVGVAFSGGGTVIRGEGKGTIGAVTVGESRNSNTVVGCLFEEECVWRRIR